MFHKTPTKNQWKILILIRVEKQSSKIELGIIKSQVSVKCWDWNRYLALQNPVVLPTGPWEPLAILTIFNESTKLFGTLKTRTPTYCLSKFCANLTAETYLIKVCKNERKRPHWMNVFSYICKVGGEKF